MLLFGLMMTALDEAAAGALKHSNWLRFALWYVPALSLLQTGNNLVTLVAGFVSSWLVIFVAIKLWTMRTRNRAVPLVSARPAPRSRFDNPPSASARSNSR
jgi:hypothetical protein